MKCPLCLKECEKGPEPAPKFKEFPMPSYYCPTDVAVSCPTDVQWHFVSFIFETKNGWGRKEQAIIPPYKIENYFDVNSPTDIPAYTDISILIPVSVSHMMEKQYLYFDRVLETPYVHMDTEEKLRNRIKLLLAFS